jgi:putative protease
MSITSAEGIGWRSSSASAASCWRASCRWTTCAPSRRHRCELEMFVHGALCVSYSGQCFSSEAWGGRSANRGQCAQACRLPYELIVDDEQRPLGDARYLLSPGDLYALRQMPEIVQIGVSALKIEGRYKDADYVALTTAPIARRWMRRGPACPQHHAAERTAAGAGLLARAGATLSRAPTIRRWSRAAPAPSRRH